MSLSVKINFRRKTRIAIQNMQIKHPSVYQKFEDGIQQAIIQTIECGKELLLADPNIAPGQRPLYFCICGMQNTAISTM